MEAFKRDRYQFYEDLTDLAPPDWQQNQHDYATFLAVPATIGSAIVGMVTVDAPNSGTLDVEDRHFLGLLGSVLALAMHETDQCSKPVSLTGTS